MVRRCRGATSRRDCGGDFSACYEGHKHGCELATRLSSIQGAPPFGHVNPVEAVLLLSTAEMTVQHSMKKRVSQRDHSTLKFDVNQAGIRHQSGQLAPDPAIAYAVAHCMHDRPRDTPAGTGYPGHLVDATRWITVDVHEHAFADDLRYGLAAGGS